MGRGQHRQREESYRTKAYQGGSHWQIVSPIHILFIGIASQNFIFRVMGQWEVSTLSPCHVQDRDLRFQETRHRGARGGVCEVLNYFKWPKEDHEALGKERHSYSSLQVSGSCRSPRFGYKRKGGGVEECKLPVQCGGSGLHQRQFIVHLFPHFYQV